jgi:hypothetical protein
LNILNGYPISESEAAGEIARDIVRSELEKYADGDVMTVVCKVTFDGNNSEPSAFPFPVVSYTIKKLDDSVVPTITSVTDSLGQVSNGGTTTDTAVTVIGRASPLQQIEIADNAVPVNTVPVDAGGNWSVRLAGLGLTAHSITAKGLYGTYPVSGVRTFTVMPHLAIGQNYTINATGYYLAQNKPPQNPPSGLTHQQSASGGHPPYSYSSSNHAVATVNTTTGKVVTIGNGTSTITVRDSVGGTAHYQLTTIGASILFRVSTQMLKAQAINYLTQYGARLPTQPQMAAFWSMYSSGISQPVSNFLGWNIPNPNSCNTWLVESNPDGSSVTYNLSNNMIGLEWVGNPMTFIGIM